MTLESLATGESTLKEALRVSMISIFALIFRRTLALREA